MDKIQPGTADGTEENIQKIAALFPEVMTEVRESDGTLRHVVDYDALHELLGDGAEGQRERYQFTWPGKAAAKAEARAAKAEGDALRARIAGEKGVPAGLLSGSTEAELLASADQLLEFKGAGQSKGAPPAGAGADPNTPAERSAKDTVDAALRR